MAYSSVGTTNIRIRKQWKLTLYKIMLSDENKILPYLQLQQIILPLLSWCYYTHVFTEKLKYNNYAFIINAQIKHKMWFKFYRTAVYKFCEILVKWRKSWHQLANLIVIIIISGILLNTIYWIISKHLFKINLIIALEFL